MARSTRRLEPGTKHGALGFTLIELLTVIAIIAIIAAILFPVYGTVRGKAREISCVSNLRQIGLSIRTYMQDYDEVFPWAVDPTDRYTPQIWAPYPEFQRWLSTMPMLHETLQPYIRSAELFHCPADTGYDIEDFTGEALHARPTSFKRFGTSYNYRTELALRQLTDAALRQPSAINVVFDAAGAWHGGLVTDRMRYNVLHGDGHVRNLSRGQVEQLWATPL